MENVLTRGRHRRRLEDHHDAARRVREAARLTQSELAEMLGVDRATISRWETGERMPRGAALTRYSELLERLASQESDR